MQYDLSTQILNLDGKPFEDGATLRTMAFAAVTAALPDDQNKDLQHKLRLYALAQTIYAGGMVDLTAEDVALIKDRAARTFAHVVALGRMCDILEGRNYVSPAQAQAAFDAAVDARDEPSGAPVP